jgi:hypothetical protein
MSRLAGSFVLVQKWFYDGILVSRFAGLKKNVPITALFPACAGSQYSTRYRVGGYLLTTYPILRVTYLVLQVRVQ